MKLVASTVLFNYVCGSNFYYKAVDSMSLPLDDGVRYALKKRY